MLSEPLKSWYYRDVDPEVPKAIARIVIEDYVLAADEMELRFLDEGADALAIIRRARIEGDLLRLRALFRDSVRVEAVKNIARNHRHREVYTGGWVFTQSMVDAPNGPIRRAEFRETLAFGTIQTTAFYQEPVANLSGQALPWGCVVHMAARRMLHTADSHPDQPAMLKVAFPMPDGQWEDTVDLYRDFPDLRRHAESEYVLHLCDEQRRRWTA